ncbi:aldo/keto reductase [Bradyrhizobium sp. ISRA442]|uniref:aldo/keto reductase n=1 Tax=Bradyrhizobium sp. ISRA442 TaxID=2866197 RepID=UPI0040497209
MPRLPAHDGSISQVALNWLLARDSHVIPIPGATKPHHARTNLDSRACMRPSSTRSTELQQSLENESGAHQTPQWGAWRRSCGNLTVRTRADARPSEPIRPVEPSTTAPGSAARIGTYPAPPRKTVADRSSAMAAAPSSDREIARPVSRPARPEGSGSS